MGCKEWIASLNITGHKKYEKILSELRIIDFDGYIGDGQNGARCGGEYTLIFSFGNNKYYCEYKMEQLHNYTYRYTFSINNHWILQSNSLKAKGTLTNLKAHENTCAYFIEICKEYDIKLNEFIHFMATLGSYYFE
jgi:hypothetical protein